MKTRHRLVVIGLLACVGSVLLAQAAAPTPAEDSHAALLAEVRALRAEVHQAASAGIRMQLLEVQNALATVRQEIAGEQARVEQLEKSLSRATAHGQSPLRQAILEAKTQIERQQRQEQELQAQETQGVKAVNDAQIQWMDFSRRLDELERSVPIESTR